MVGLNGYTKSSRPPARRFAATPKTTVTDLTNWIANASPGDVLEYFRGHLAADRVVAGSRLGPEVRDELDRVADAAMALAQAGRGHLVQRRHGSDDFGYLLVARPRPAFSERALAGPIAAAETAEPGR